MTTRMNRYETNTSFFITFTCYEWLPLFEITNAYQDIYKWFNILKNDGNKILGYVIMPNHLHAIILLLQQGVLINDLIGEGKKFRAWEIIKQLQTGKRVAELEILKGAVSESERKKGSKHKVFTESFDAKECYSSNFIQQKLTYMHENPVKAGLVSRPEDYTHSSAQFYATGIQGVYPVTHFLDHYDVEQA